jgi:hypothetical protein
MKTQIKERMSIRKWINGLNSWLLDNTAVIVIENDNIHETEKSSQNDKISETDHQSQNHGRVN